MRAAGNAAANDAGQWVENRANDLDFIQDAARWLAGWSYDLFTFDKAWARVVCGYGLAAVVYLFIGHGLANRLRRY